MLDTDVAIHLRDGDPWVQERVRELDPPLFISAISRIELENGVWRDSAWSHVRKTRLKQLLLAVQVIGFGEAEIGAYCDVVASAGYSRRKTADRMTASTAIAHNLPLITFNAPDFRDIPKLQLVEWSRDK